MFYKSLKHFFLHCHFICLTYGLLILPQFYSTILDNFISMK